MAQHGFTCNFCGDRRFTSARAPGDGLYLAIHPEADPDRDRSGNWRRPDCFARRVAGRSFGLDDYARAGRSDGAARLANQHSVKAGCTDQHPRRVAIISQRAEASAYLRCNHSNVRRDDRRVRDPVRHQRAALQCGALWHAGRDSDDHLHSGLHSGRKDRRSRGAQAVCDRNFSQLRALPAGVDARAKFSVSDRRLCYRRPARDRRTLAQGDDCRFCA